MPFDAETILMIKCVTGNEPEIKEYSESFKMKIYVQDKSEYIVKAVIDAVIGRYGMRVRAVEHIRERMILRGAIFNVDYEKDADKYPIEIHSDLKQPNEAAGCVYCRRLLEVRALRVSRDNLEVLNEFTGGGTMTIPREPGGIAIYSFPNENGVLLDIPEDWMLLRYPGGSYAKMDYKTFVANFEEKSKNIDNGKNPDSMQKGSAKEPENPVCGNCKNFLNEDIAGDGFCNEQNRMRHCSFVGCQDWEVKQSDDVYQHFMDRFNKKQ